MDSNRELNIQTNKIVKMSSVSRKERRKLEIIDRYSNNFIHMYRLKNVCFVFEKS
jgi:hypothetical protein